MRSQIIPSVILSKGTDSKSITLARDNNANGKETLGLRTGMNPHSFFVKAVETRVKYDHTYSWEKPITRIERSGSSKFIRVSNFSN